MAAQGLPAPAHFAWNLALSGIVLVSGCAERDSNTATPAPTATNSAMPAADSAEHGHKAGTHGGVLISLGRDSYHVEAVFEKNGVLRLFTLGKVESRVIDVERQTLKGFVKADGESEAEQFTLESEPQDGDAEDHTSQFVGTLPMHVWGRNVEVTVPNIAISGERFRLSFKSAAEQHETGMPNTALAANEQALFLTPGGLYSNEDIQANGRTTAASKFKGLMASHNSKPKPGDKVCPISMTKANPKFTWIVGGKSYEFCCPPCVDEFVQTAKAKPDEIKPPEDYVQRQ